MSKLLINREWAMPSPNTFSIKPVASLLGRYIKDSDTVIDPFARTSRWGTITNDLDPTQPTDYHLEASEFCQILRDGVTADVVLFDPPYSPRQISEVYASIGRRATGSDTQNARLYKNVRDGLDNLLKPGGIAISCGWNSSGFGKTRHYEMLEILLVAHGGAHNDTIVVVECKR